MALAGNRKALCLQQKVFATCTRNVLETHLLLYENSFFRSFAQCMFLYRLTLEVIKEPFSLFFLFYLSRSVWKLKLLVMSHYLLSTIIAFRCKRKGLLSALFQLILVPKASLPAVSDVAHKGSRWSVIAGKRCRSCVR